MTDWSSYDSIAGRYDDVWGSRFESVARSVADRVPLAPGESVLDIGTGTGIVLRTFASAASRLVGCDRSTGMIDVARSRVRAGRFVAADAVTLPFRDSSFDVVIASFVLSHLGNHQAALAEARRVLRARGRFAMTSWAADADVYGEAWRELLASVVSKELVQAAVARVAPREAHFESAEGVDGALTAAGFAAVEVRSVTLEYTIPLDHFLADRELSSAGRFARHALGAEGWPRFVTRAREVLGRRFGATFHCTRHVLVGVGTRAA
jgi:ubiquinone/menaquinone biosynthesis C-methylase UbiE